MYFIAAFGMLMMCLSILMIVNPEQWSRGIVRFSEKTYFHGLEITTRLLSGVLFVTYSEQVKLSIIFSALGYLMIGVAAGLIIIGSKLHIRFAIWSAESFRGYFRFAGVASIFGGAAIVYLSLS